MVKKMEIKTIEFEIEGVPGVPLKMDKWLDLPQPTSTEGWLEQAKEKAYRDENGDLCIEARAIKACMREAYADDTFGKMKGKKHRQEIRAQLFVHPLVLTLGKKDYDGIAEDVVSRKTGAKITRVTTYRPLIKEWKCSGVIKVFGLEEKLLKQIMEVGGFKYALYGYRPEFGRFIVNKFEVIENEKKE